MTWKSTKPPTLAIPRSHTTSSPESRPYRALQIDARTRAITTAATARPIPTTNFAATTNGRRGSSENVTIAVRWLHSLVSSRMPRTGSRMAIEKFVDVRKSR